MSHGALRRLLRVSTLDDAREGMDLVHPSAGRPVRSRQRPLARDHRDPGRQGRAGGRSSQLADTAEHQVRAIIEELAERVVAGEHGPRRRRDADRLPLRLVHGRGRAIEGLGPRADAGRCWPRSTACATSATSRRSSASSSRSAAAARSASTSTSTARTPTAAWSTSSRAALGLPDESYYRDEKFAEIREKYVAFLTRHVRPGRATPTRPPPPPP